MAAQEFAVESQSVGVVIVRCAEDFPPGALGGRHHGPQFGVREGPVADEVDSFDTSLAALVDLEHQVNAVLRQPNDLRLDTCGKQSGTAVDRDDPLHIGLHTGAREHGARPQLHFLQEILVLDLAVALEIDAIDDRIFFDLDHQCVAAAEDLHIREQPGPEQGFERSVDLHRIERIANRNLHIGSYGLRLDPLIAFNGDDGNDGLRGRRRDNPQPGSRQGTQGEDRDGK